MRGWRTQRSWWQWVAMGVLTLAAFVWPLHAVRAADAQGFDSARDMAVAGDEANLFLYNVVLSGNHSGNKADTEGGMAVAGDALIPQGGAFNYGAYFDANATNGVGAPLTPRHRIALLLQGQLHAFGVATISNGLLIASQGGTPWWQAPTIQYYGQPRVMTPAQMTATFSQLDAAVARLQARLNGYVADQTPLADGPRTLPDGNGRPAGTIARSQLDPGVLVVTVPALPGTDIAYMPQVNGIDDLIDDPTVRQIIVTTTAARAVFRADAVYPGQALLAADKWQTGGTNASRVAAKMLFYLPNATQVTNFGWHDQAQTAPDLTRGPGGAIDPARPLTASGADQYDDKYFAQYGVKGTAVIGSVIALRATVVLKAGNINGYVVARNLHQRDGAEAHNFYNPWLESTSLTLTKVWADGGDQDGLRQRLGTLTFDLYAHTDQAPQPVWLRQVTLPVTATDERQTLTLDGLPKFTEAGELIHYTAEERLPADCGYQSSVSADGLTVTNHHVPATTRFTVTKQWQDHADDLKKRPASLRVQLTQTDTVTGESVVADQVTLTAADGWQHTWTGLPQFAAHGHRLQYAVSEPQLPAGYRGHAAAVTDGTLLTNRYQPTTFGLRLTKRAAGTAQPLAGATFRVGTAISDAPGGEQTVVADATARTATTDADGRLVVTGLTWAPGRRYYLQEVTPPKGYARDPRITSIVVQADDQTAAHYTVAIDGDRVPLAADGTVATTRTDQPLTVLPHTGDGGPQFGPALWCFGLALLGVLGRAWRKVGVRHG